MYHLGRKTSRDIISVLFSGPKTIEELRNLLGKKSNSSILRIVYELEKDGIVFSRDADKKLPGRRKKIYFLKMLEIPKLTLEDIRMILKGLDIRSNKDSEDILTFRLRDLANIKIKSRGGHMIKFSPIKILNRLINVGFDFADAFLVVYADLSEILYYGIPEEDIERTLDSIVESKFPEYANKFKISRGGIMVVVRSDKKVKVMNFEDLRTIASLELGLSEADSGIIVSELLDLLNFAGIGKIGYANLVFLMCIIAEHRNVRFEEPAFFRVGVPQDSHLVALSENVTEEIINCMWKAKSKNLFSIPTKPLEEIEKIENEFKAKTRRMYPYFVQALAELAKTYFPPPPFEKTTVKAEIQVFTNEGSREMGNFELTDYLIHIFGIEESLAEQIAQKVLQRLIYLSFREYSLTLIMEICKLILSEHEIEFSPPFITQ